MLKDVLKRIGLTDKESEIYLILLELGSSPVNRIYEKTGIQRRNIYDLLNKLIDKGLVSYVVEDKKKYFQAKHPKRLIEYLNEQKELLEENKTKVEQNLNALTAKYEGVKTEQEAEIYRGLEGIKTILLDCLNEKEVLFIGATGLVSEKLLYFWPQYNKKRIARGINWKLLLNSEAKSKPITKSKLYSFKVLPPEMSGPNVIYIYGNKIANMLWAEPPISFVIKDKRIAENYKKYFNFLWKKIK
jgi:sugar-specific transcriptional regulator TrmB